MIKGLIAIFTSGLIFRPMVILGIIIGCTAMFALDEKQIHLMFTTPVFYIALYIPALIYSLTYGRIFFKTGRTNFKASFYGSFGHFFHLLLSLIFTSLLILTFSFGNFEDSSSKDSEYTQQEIDAIINKAKELQKSGY